MSSIRGRGALFTAGQLGVVPSMKLGIATDIHLDVLCPQDRRGYPHQRVAGERLARGYDALVITGDISTGDRFENHFRAFCAGAEVPVYFVLGNHDFWDAPEAEVRATAARFEGCLDRGEVVELAPGVALVGRSGWYDTLSGNPFSSGIHPQDWDRTERLASCWRVPHLLYKACQRWSEEEAEKASQALETAAQGDQRVFFATHFPCFREACFGPDGRHDDGSSGWWPWSINTTMGHTIRDVAEKYPDTEFTILTGHTHGGGAVQIAANIECFAGRAEYGYPDIARSFDL